MAKTLDGLRMELILSLPDLSNDQLRAYIEGFDAALESAQTYIGRPINMSQNTRNNQIRKTDLKYQEYKSELLRRGGDIPF